MTRAFLFVLDSVGIGGAIDADRFNDIGSNTIGHILEQTKSGNADAKGVRSGALHCPNLAALGFFHALKLASGHEQAQEHMPFHVSGFWGASDEVSKGKDTPSGHWEIAGVPVNFEWGYFSHAVPAFPAALLAQIYKATGIEGSLANCHASGTEVIAQFGEESIKTGKPIFYTSSDSVFQIAAHEEHFGLDRLDELCRTVRLILDDHNIGRVIARPFIGKDARDFVRTGNRRDYSVLPPEPTLLDRIVAHNNNTIAVGKIGDIFAHQGISEVRKAHGNEAIAKATLAAMDDAQEGDLVFSNFVDFDQLYGHRRDVAGYAAALEYFDSRLPEFQSKMMHGDLLIITADHGCDPTWPGTDHTRERVPVIGLLESGKQEVNIGLRSSFADIGETIAEHLKLAAGSHGTSFLKAISNA